MKTRLSYAFLRAKELGLTGIFSSLRRRAAKKIFLLRWGKKAPEQDKSKESNLDIRLFWEKSKQPERRTYPFRQP